MYLIVNIQSLKQTIKYALSDQFIDKCSSVINIYGAGKAAKIIVNNLEAVEFNVNKRFRDLDS